MNLAEAAEIMGASFEAAKMSAELIEREPALADAVWKMAIPLHRALAVMAIRTYDRELLGRVRAFLEEEGVDDERIEEDYPDLAEQTGETITEVEAIFEAARRDMKNAAYQFCPRTKKVRGLARKTQDLRNKILSILGGTDKPITVRQGYYLAETRDAVEKSEGGYRRVQRQLLMMRREGIIPYGWIADGTRWRQKPDTYDSAGEMLDDGARLYRQRVWSALNVYVEVWCEKDSISGVIYPVTSVYDVPLMVARGDSSETFAYESAEEIMEQGKPAFVYYVGDFDPAGWDMSRVLEEKLRGFGANITFERLAINRDQIKRWNLSTRPTKDSTRTKKFFETFGDGTPSVELEALHPDTLRTIVRDAIEKHIPAGHLDTVKVAEESERTLLKKLAAVAAGGAR